MTISEDLQAVSDSDQTVRSDPIGGAELARSIAPSLASAIESDQVIAEHEVTVVEPGNVFPGRSEVWRRSEESFRCSVGAVASSDPSFRSSAQDPTRSLASIHCPNVSSTRALASFPGPITDSPRSFVSVRSRDRNA